MLADDPNLFSGVTAEQRREVVAWLAKLNEQVDYDETILTPFDPKEHFLWPKPGVYDAKHHFDRAPGKSHQLAFANGANYVRYQWEQTREFLEEPTITCSCAAAIFLNIARALHALQDAYSHSNYADSSDGLNASQREQFDKALIPTDGPTTRAPSGIKLTLFGFRPGVQWPRHDDVTARGRWFVITEYGDPEDPENTCDYCHKKHSKHVSGDPGFDDAESAAKNATKSFMNSLLTADFRPAWTSAILQLASVKSSKCPPLERPSSSRYPPPTNIWLVP